MKRIIVLMCSCVFAFAAGGQNLSFYGVLPAWSQTGKISDRLGYNVFISSTFDAFERRINSVEYPATDLQFYLQPSLLFNLNSHVQLASSYTYQRNNPFNGNFVNEHRIWEQVLFSSLVFRGRLTNRFRFEERFIENEVEEKFPLSTRLRYQVGFSCPLQGKTLEANEFYINTYNEVYFSLSGLRNAFYSENWSYLALGYSTKSIGRIELGLMEQIAVRNKDRDLRFLNLAQVMWITNFDFRKK